MRQVIIVSLNNNAYHIHEEGYSALRKYLDRARRGLSNNPDIEEILSDLERAIGEKCAAAIGPGKNVVTAEDMWRILQEMGPVVGDSGEPEQEAKSERTSGGTASRLYRKTGPAAKIGGVCAGLADYFDVDVLLVRLAFAALVLFSGAGVVLYIIMMIVVPPEDSAPYAADATFRPKSSKIALAIVLGILALAAGSTVMSWPVFYRQGMPVFGVAEMFMMFVLLAFFTVIAAVVGYVVISLLRQRRPGAR